MLVMPARRTRTDTNEQAAVFGSRCDPELFAAHLDGLARLYGGAPVLVERNNDGHAVHQALRGTEWLLYGRDRTPGWQPRVQHDDRAIACILAAVAFYGAHSPVPSVIIPPKPVREASPGRMVDNRGKRPSRSIGET